MSSNTNNLRAILAGLIRNFTPDELLTPLQDGESYQAHDIDSAIAAVLALLPEKRQVRPKPTTIGEILQGQPYPVDQYNGGFNSAIDQTRRKLIGEQL